MRVKPVIISTTAGMKVSAVISNSVWMVSEYVVPPPAAGVLVTAGSPPAAWANARPAGSSSTRKASRRLIMVLPIGNALQPLGEGLVGPGWQGALGQTPLGQAMQGANLPGNDADDQPVVTYLDEHDALARAERHTADHFQAGLAESLAARNLARHPGGRCEQANDENQRKPGLQVGARRYARRSGFAGLCGNREKQEKCA